MSSHHDSLTLPSPLPTSTAVAITTPCFLISLPESLLYNILTYLSTPRTRVTILCHNILPLSTSIYNTLTSSHHADDLWSALLREYTHPDECDSETTTTYPPTTSITHDHHHHHHHHGQQQNRRTSKRLRRTPQSLLRHAHLLFLERTLIAITCICDLALSSPSPSSSSRRRRRDYNNNNTNSSNGLSVSRLRSLLKEYEPVAINYRVDAFGTFLADVCRARHVTESVILKCVRVLVEEWHADVNVGCACSDGSSSSRRAVTSSRRRRTAANVDNDDDDDDNNKETTDDANNATMNSSSNNNEGLTPLCIAAARGMSTVVKYLLSKGSDERRRGRGRFRLYGDSYKSISGCLTPLQFAKWMREAEARAGVAEEDLDGLDRCIRLLVRREEERGEKEGNNGGGGETEVSLS